MRFGLATARDGSRQSAAKIDLRQLVVAQSMQKARVAPGFSISSCSVIGVASVDWTKQWLNPTILGMSARRAPRTHLIIAVFFAGWGIVCAAVGSNVVATISCEILAASYAFSARKRSTA